MKHEFTYQTDDIDEHTIGYPDGPVFCIMATTGDERDAEAIVAALKIAESVMPLIDELDRVKYVVESEDYIAIERVLNEFERATT